MPFPYSLPAGETNPNQGSLANASKQLCFMLGALILSIFLPHAELGSACL